MEKIKSFTTNIIGVIVYTEDKTYRIEKTEIADLFIKYGGSFTQALGQALYRADEVNTSKILNTWDDMTKEYLEKFYN